MSSMSPSSSVSSLAGGDAQRPPHMSHHSTPSTASSASEISSGMLSDHGAGGSTGRSLSPASGSLSTTSNSSDGRHVVQAAADAFSAPPGGQGRIKRALAARRKKKNDSVGSTAMLDGTTSGDELSSASGTSALSVAQRAARWGGQVRANTGQPLTKLSMAMNVFARGKRSSSAAQSQLSPTPPAPPPKPERLRAMTVPLSTSGLQGPGSVGARTSFVPSPSISAALKYMSDSDAEAARRAHEPPAEASRYELAEEERDEITPTNSVLRRQGTTTSSADHRRVSVAATIRPVSGAPSIATITAANAAPFQNDDAPSDDGHAQLTSSFDTVPPPVAERAASAYPDSDDQPNAHDDSHIRAAAQHQSSSVPDSPDPSSRSPALAHTVFGATSNLSKQQKRRSMSLDLSVAKTHWASVQPAPYSSSLDVVTAHLARTPPATPPARSLASHSPSSVSRPNASPAPSSTSGEQISLGERLTALGLAQEPPQHPARRGQMLSQPSPPPPSRTAPSAYNSGLQPPPARRTAVSMTQSLQQSLAPAAAAASGMAIVFGKKAYDKVERLWGGNNTAPGAAPPSNRAASSGATGATRNGGLRRTPNAPSGAWSVASMSLSSDEGGSYSGGPHIVGAELGTCLRQPRAGSAYNSHTSGLVFGRALAECVRDTRVTRVVNVTASSPRTPGFRCPPHNIEDRALPALIVRCVQHLRRWGVEEEGLFRISGRASHIAKLRSEFDTGADYDLKESNPGQLDPHAVASVFKAYLRELPEPLLTRSLTPLFDDIVASTPNTHNQQMHDFYGLPSGPRAVPQMRKPPSLSHLGPNASPLLVHKVSTLIARLPVENRDLLFTVIDLLKTTASNAKSTKMPLANLLLLFCPSLQVSPTLLRLLCEADNIWDGPLPPPGISPSASATGHETVHEESDSERLSEESLRLPTVRHDRVVSGVGLGALRGGPRPRQGVPMRQPMPGMSSSQLADVFSSQLSTPSPSAGSTPSINLVAPDDKPLPLSPRTPRTPEARTSDGAVSLPSRRLSIFGVGKSPTSSSSQVSTPNSVRSYDETNPPPSPSLKGKRNGMRPSLQLMFSNKRSREDLLSPRSSTSSPLPGSSGTPQSTTLTLPPVLTLPAASPGFSTSLESFMSEDARASSPAPQSNDFLGSTLSLAVSSASSSSSSRSTSSLVIAVSEEARNLSSRNLPTGRRSPSPRPVSAAIMTTSPAATSSSDETPVQTPIADMFRSPSRAGTLAEEPEHVVVLHLPPLSFSQSPMFSPHSNTISPPPPRQPIEPFTPPPRLDLKMAQEQEDDEDDWAHVVLRAARDSPVKPVRVRDAVQHLENRRL